MTTLEFSDEFDVLLNTKSINKNFGIAESPIDLDEYEKSVLLTTAQEEVVRSLYDDKAGYNYFEKTEELRRSLDNLIVTAKPVEVTDKIGLDNKSRFYQLPPDLWFITYESVDLSKPYCDKNPTVKVIPTRQDEWNRLKDNPFKRPNMRKVIRLDNGSSISELVSEVPITNYVIRYLKQPKPIILTDLEGVTINNEYKETQCELNPSLHRIILERAVQYARARSAQAR